jgi:F0F1-type ATP synthase membrane subunit b/b'
MTDRPGQSPYESPQVESVLRELRDLIGQARPMPLSTSVMINQAEVLDLIDEAAERLPEELRSAKWLLKQREEFLARTRREADEIVEAARQKADQMVQQTEVVKAAESRARTVVDAADAEARRLKLEAEDFCDQRLASFEIVLERTMKVVSAGRAKLQGSQAAQDERDLSEGGQGPRTGEVDAVPDEAAVRRRRLEAVPDPGGRSSSGDFFDQDERDS